MQFFQSTANLSPFSDHTNITHDLQLLSLVATKTKLCTPFASYTFLVADY